jgi:16S rRNA (adenine1518-N6/adenine1519-N6)-dimethyltransferase
VPRSVGVGSASRAVGPAGSPREMTGLAGRRRALGQHFLADDAVADRIVEAVGAGPGDLVCEIGAGPGVLTRRLAGRAGRLIALEIDPGLQTRLAAEAARIGWSQVEVRQADARSFAYDALEGLRPGPGGRVLVVGNLPYSASKPILARVLAARAAIHSAVVMVQREVAERLTARPGGREYGLLSVFWQLWADLELLFPVPPTAFRPPPAVESSVVRAVFRATPRVALADPQAFARVARAAFAQRRKTLENALRGGLPEAGADGVRAALATAGIDGRRRAETLTLEELARLAGALAAVPPPGAASRPGDPLDQSGAIVDRL